MPGITVVLPWVALIIGTVGAVAIGVTLWRGGAATALSVLREANAILSAKVEEGEKERQKQRDQIALLEATRSLEPMVAAVVVQFELHEKRAAERHERSLTVLDLIAKRLGPDPNGGHA